MKTKDVRFQVRFEGDTIQKLKKLGDKKGVSVAKLIRQAINKQYGI
jgi:hypothetical protein